MKTFRRSLVLVAVCFLLVRGASTGVHGAPASHEEKELLPATEHQLAQARKATARYHDVEEAEADGYVNIHLYLPGEGFHWVKSSLIDGNFDPAHPEVLLYAPVHGEKRLELVGVEYLVPVNASAGPPAGFIGDADQWRKDTEGFGFWELNAWIWLHNPEGIFGHDNPRVR
jgi:hypothetical protein